MEPLSAFALASSVLQVVEFGVRLIAKATEYRASDNAYLAEHGNLRGIAESLNSMSNGLSASLERQKASKQPEAEELHLIKMNEECLRISKAFVGSLDDLKLKDKRAIIDSVRMSLRALWHKDKVENMEKTVSQARNNLNIALLIFIKYVNYAILSFDSRLMLLARNKQHVRHKMNFMSSHHLQNAES